MQLVLFLSGIITGHGFGREGKSVSGPRHDSSISSQAVYQWSYILDKVGALTRLIKIYKKGCLTRNNTVAVYKTKASRLKSEQVKQSFSCKILNICVQTVVIPFEVDVRL